MLQLGLALEVPCNECEGFIALSWLVGWLVTVRIVDCALLFEKMDGISMAFKTFAEQKRVLFGGFKTEKT